VKRAWDDCATWEQAMILAFDQVCQHDEMEEKQALAGAKGAKTSQGSPGRPSGRKQGKR